MQFIDLIRSSLVDIKLDEVITVQPQACESFFKLMDIYKQDMTITQSFEDCMAVCAAVNIAVALEGDPLWLYLVAPPSSGKSTICELLGSDEIHTCCMDTLTGIVSGDRKGRHMIPMMQGRCVIVKDGTLLLESSPQQLSNVYGELRSVYDGSLVKHFRNGVSAEFSNVAFGMIIGITERVYSLNMAALGERFLHCRMETTREIEQIRNRQAISRIFDNTKRTNFEGNESGDSRSFPKQRAYTAGFLSHLHTRIRSEDIIKPRYTDYDLQLIQALADVIACSRAQAPRSKDPSAELLYDARPEASTRVVKQLSRLALCLCYVLGVNSITSQIRELLTKVALDTSFSRQHNIIRTVALSKGMNRQSIAMLTDMSLVTISKRIDDLISLGILISDSRTTRPARGRSVPVLECTPWIRDAFRMVERHVRSHLPHSQSARPERPHPPRRQGRPVSSKR